MTLQLGYLALTLFTLLFLAFIGLKAIKETSPNPSKDKFILLGGLSLWQLYIYLVTSSGFITNYEFPPRFAMTMIVPSFIFTGIFLYWNRNKKWIHSIPQHWIVYFQSFRILVETLFVFSVAEGILHYQASIEGYNFDMVFAFTAPIVGYLVYHKKVWSKKAVLIWNYLGIAVLASVIFVFMTTTYAPQMYGSATPLLPLEALMYPYVLIAGFLMPTAVFLHVLSIVQIKNSH